MNFYDTSSLLLLQEEAFSEQFYCSDITLRELEDIKTSKHKTDEIKFQARNLTRLLDQHYGEYKVVCWNETMKDINDSRNDTKIIQCAYSLFGPNKELIFVTNDICAKNIAANYYKLPVKSIEKISEKPYTGYNEIQMTDEEMAYFYGHLNENIYNLLTNQYLIVSDRNEVIVDTLKWDGLTYTALRQKPYKSNMFGTLKPLDPIQSCAMDSINTNDITVLYGRAGSGKTTIPLNYIMQSIEKGKIHKCYIVYSYEPLRGAKVLGFEKGTHEDKLLLSASIGNILAAKFGDIEQVRYMLDKGILDIIPTANIRGVEFESDSCCYVTESQNLDIYTLKTIIQRCKSGCKQIYEGDIIEQRDTDIQDTGIKRLIEVFKGNEHFGCVKLKNNYRSELSGLADYM